jgi:hypothetical protein
MPTSLSPAVVLHRLDNALDEQDLENMVKAYLLTPKQKMLLDSKLLSLSYVLGDKWTMDLNSFLRDNFFHPWNQFLGIQKFAEWSDGAEQQIANMLSSITGQKIDGIIVS